MNSINESLLYKLLVLVSNQDELFTLIQDDIITAMVQNGFVMIIDDTDINTTFLTDHGQKCLNELEIKLN